jgi:hypothetical protein
MKEKAMKRIPSVELWLALAIVALIFSLALATGCKVEKPPFPNPEPTPAPTIVVVEPTAVPSDAATCYVKVPPGTPPICRNAAGAQVPCPAQMGDLAVCGN